MHPSTAVTHRQHARPETRQPAPRLTAVSALLFLCFTPRDVLVSTAKSAMKQRFTSIDVRAVVNELRDRWVTVLFPGRRQARSR